MRITIRWGLLTAFALTLFPLTSAHGACLPLALNGINPGSGVGGDAVTLSGTGFCGSPTDFFAWGWDGTRGFAFDLQAVAPGTLDGTVRATPTAVSGPVRLWKVQEVSLPDSVLQLSQGVYWLHAVRLYLFRDEAVGPSFGALATPGAGYASQLVGGNLQIDFSTGGSSLHALPQKGTTVSPGPGEGSYISIMVVAETDGDQPKGSEPEPTNDSGPFRWALKFEVLCFGAPPGCDNPLVDVVGATLGNQLGSLGMQVSVAGSMLTLGHTGYNLASGMVAVNAAP